MRIINLLSLSIVLIMAGCMSVKRGDFEIRAVATDLSTKEFEYTKTIGGITNEHWRIKGQAANQSESTHWVCNAVCSIAGACIGAPAGPVGVAGGAAAGGGISELFQKWLDKGKKLAGMDKK